MLMSHETIDEMAMIDELASELGAKPPECVKRLYATFGGCRISALQWGARRPQLVLLHGGSLHAHAWDAMLLQSDLPALGVLAFDLPGHGHSAWFEEPLYLPDQLLPVLAPAIEALADGPVTVVGHSLGGLAALALAARRPDLVDRLVLVDATPGSTPDRSEELVAFATAGDFASFEDALDLAAAYKPHRNRESLRRPLLLNTRQREDGRWDWRHDTRSGTTVDRWSKTFDEMPKHWADAAEVRCPTLLVRGVRSPIVLASDVERYRRSMSDLRVVEMRDAGHNIHGDQPVALAAAIARFMGEGGHRR